MHALIRPRHLIATCLVFLVLGGAGAGVVGANAADDAQHQALVAGFHVPLPAQGDIGRFTLQEEGTLHDRIVAAREQHQAANPQLYPDGFEETRKEFRWMEDRLLPTPDGELVLSNRLRYNTAPLYVNGIVGPIMEAGSNEPFGHEWITAREDDGEEEVNMRFEYTSIAGVPCHLRNGFQGKTFDVTAQPVHLAMTCKAPATYEQFAETWTVLGVVPDSDPAIVVVENERQSPSFVARTEMWLQHGLAYPIRVVDEWERTRGDPLWGRTTLVLEAFSPGREPIATTPERTPLPPIAFTQRQGVPSDAMLDMRFPLRTAFEVLQGEADVEAFLAQYPDAYLGYAQHYAFTTDEERTLDTWVLVLAHGNQTLGREVSQWSGPMVVQQPFGPVTSVPLPIEDEPTYEVEPGTIGRPDAFPLAEELPHSMPRLGDLVKQWRAVVETHRQAPPLDSWGFDLSEGTMRVNVGHYRFEVDDDEPFGPGEWQVTTDMTRMTWNGTRITAFGEQRQSPDDEPHASTWSAASFRAVPDSAWIPLTPLQAVSVTLGALLVAALYYLAPMLKHGVFAGFSRIRDDKVLDHPVRQQALAAIQSEPGIHHRELMRRLGAGQGATSHHLRKLLDAGTIDRVQQGRYTCYFARGDVDRRVRLAAPVLRAPAARQLVACLQASPGATGPELLERVAVGQSTLQYHLKRLQEARIVEGTRAGKRVAWHLTPEGEDAVRAGLSQ